MYHILFVDDHADILEANRSYFAEEGFSATACGSGREAVALLRRETFDCIVLDVMMPGMDGYEVCRAMRVHTDTPVIFLSCLDQPDDKVKALMLGGDAYMVKPYHLRELHAQVMACIRRGDRRPPAGGDFAIDRERRIVRLYEHSAVLSKKELALLTLLLEQPGRTHPREGLCAALWPGEQPDENRLHSLVRNLRRKVDFAAARIGEIVAVYGTGYRLEPPGGGGTP